MDATAFPGPTPTAQRAFQLWQGPAMCTCLAQLGAAFATDESDAWARIASGTEVPVQHLTSYRFSSSL